MRGSSQHTGMSGACACVCGCAFACVYACVQLNSLIQFHAHARAHVHVHSLIHLHGMCGRATAAILQLHLTGQRAWLEVAERQGSTHNTAPCTLSLQSAGAPCNVQVGKLCATPYGTRLSPNLESLFYHPCSHSFVTQTSASRVPHTGGQAVRHPL